MMKLLQYETGMRQKGRKAIAGAHWCHCRGNVALKTFAFQNPEQQVLLNTAELCSSAVAIVTTNHPSELFGNEGSSLLLLSSRVATQQLITSKSVWFYFKKPNCDAQLGNVASLTS